jgi:hypothetical protein
MRDAFYTPNQMGRIVRKAMRLGLLTSTDMWRVFTLLPILGLSFARRMIMHQAHKRGIGKE